MSKLCRRGELTKKKAIRSVPLGSARGFGFRFGLRQGGGRFAAALFGPTEVGPFRFGGTGFRFQDTYFRTHHEGTRDWLQVSGRNPGEDGSRGARWPTSQNRDMGHPI